MRSWKAMRHDNELAKKVVPLHPDDEPSLWYDFTHWAEFYCPLTRRWMPKVSLWWHYNVRRYPKPPPLDQDRVYQRLFPPCPDCGYREGHTEVCAGFARNDPANPCRHDDHRPSQCQRKP